MTKVTYLLGAGASYEAVPIVGEMEQRVLNIHNALCHDKYESGVKEVNIGEEGYKKWREHKHIHKLQNAKNKLDESEQKLLNKFNQDLFWLYAGMEKHASVDTYAKKLWLQHGVDSDALRKLKQMITIYLTIEQVINPIDDRYDKFFATILEQSVTSFPDNIDILSWNYDYQIELAYNDYSDNENISLNIPDLNVLVKGDIDRDKAGFYINKLNGIAGIRDYYPEPTINLPIDEKSQGTITNLLKIILKYYNYHIDDYDSNNEVNPTISFAWEDDTHDPDEEKSVVEIAKSSIKEASHIVIIGYSFPYFNARIDKELFSGINYTKKKIYVQDPDYSKVAASLKEVTSFGENLNIENVGYTEEFFIPYDFFG